MLPRRVVAISPDKAVRKRLGVGLLAAGVAVDLETSLRDLGPGALDTELVVVHADEGTTVDVVRSLCDRVASHTRIIAILPKSDLEAAVALMQISDRLSAVLVAEDLDVSVLSAAASRVLRGDIFGLEKLVSWGTRVHSVLVGSYKEKLACIAEVSQFAETMGVRRKYRESIEQCVDEMLMNALYDAPVDERGDQIFADVAIKDRIAIELDDKAIVQYACNDEIFFLSVRDRHGSLDRDTVFRYLDKCLHAKQQIDRKSGGAGLGLYLMASSATTFLFNVVPGVATECICTFHLAAPKLRAQNIAFYTDRIDASGRLAGHGERSSPTGFPIERRASPPPPDNRWVLLGLSSAIVLLLALIALVAYPRLTTDRGALAIATDPAGAAIEIDGRGRGTTAAGPITVDDLEAERAYRVRASRDGYEPVESVAVPVAGETTRVSLTLAPRSASVSLSSRPEGATVSRGDRVLGVTPLELRDLPPGQDIELEFSRAGYESSTRQVRVPEAGGSLVVSASLELSGKVGSVRIESDPPGAQVYRNGDLLAGVVTPVAEYLLPAGEDIVLTLASPGHRPVDVPVRLARGERRVPVTATLEPGGTLRVQANLRARVTVRGVEGCRNLRMPATCALESGSYVVLLYGTNPAIAAQLPVEVAGADVDLELELGVVETSGDERIVLSPERQVARAAFPAGTRRLTLADSVTGETREVAIDVPATGRTTVPPPAAGSKPP